MSLKQYRAFYSIQCRRTYSNTWNMSCIFMSVIFSAPDNNNDIDIHDTSNCARQPRRAGRHVSLPQATVRYLLTNGVMTANTWCHVYDAIRRTNAPSSGLSVTVTVSRPRVIGHHLHPVYPVYIRLCYVPNLVEDRSVNDVTILSTDAGRTDGRLRDFIFWYRETHVYM